MTGRSERNSSSGFDDVVADGVAYQFRHRMTVEAAHYVGAVGLRGLHADVQRYGHFLAALALGQQLKNLLLPRRQAQAILAIVIFIILF